MPAYLSSAFGQDGKTPSAFRHPIKSNRSGEKALFRCKLTLSYRPPFDWQGMLGFFQSRAIPGVESVVNGVYHRTIRINETTGMISVAHSDKDNALLLTTALSASRDLMPLVERVRRMFDLDANMMAIHKVFAADSVLKEVVRKQPGLRLPGAWDPFEVAVRAVVGQQISVKGARTVIGRIAAKAGPQFESADLGIIKALQRGDKRPTRKQILERSEEWHPWRAYFKCELKHFNIPLAPVGTPFQLKVWQALRNISYGELVSYKTIAKAIGNPKAVRAVGGANGKNPIPIIVPCHRIIGSDGSLTGFGGGLQAKKRLIDLERSC